MHLGQRAIEGIPEHEAFGYTVHSYYQGVDGKLVRAYQRGRNSRFA